MREVSQEVVAERGRIEKLKPKESDFMGKKGYRRKYNPDGSYQWRYRFKPNDGRKATREFNETVEMMRPFSRAAVELSSREQAKQPKVAMRDLNGNVQNIAPHLADKVARGGWRHAFMGRGTVTMVARAGVLWKMTRSGWRMVQAPKKREGLLSDPAGELWRHVSGRWRHF